MKIKSILYFLVLLLPLSVSGQYDHPFNKIWIFGHHAGLDFNHGNPLPFTSAIHTRESSASICDDGGQLLFYTNGEVTYDRFHQPMPNGTALPPGTQSSVQGSLIVPVRDSYYVFSIPGREDAAFGKVYYSVVHMSLNNGLGDVVPGRNNILLSTGNTESMTAVRGTNCNIWLLVHIKDIGIFRAFEINDRGINTQPVVSYAGSFTGGSNDVGFPYLGAYRIGMMKASPDGRKIAMSCLRNDLGSTFTADGGTPIYRFTQDYGLELYDFDNATGTVSNTVIIEPAGYAFYPSVCFSPDNSKLYTHRIEYFNDFEVVQTGLFQYDLSGGNATRIRASKRIVHLDDTSVFSHTDMKIGPDGHIYCSVAGGMVDSFSKYNNAPVRGRALLHRIEFPNLPAPACQFTANVVKLLPGTNCAPGLPNEVVTYLRDTLTSSRKIVVCYADSFVLNAGIDSGWQYQWNNGFSGQASQTTGLSGTFWVTYKTPCKFYTDTFKIEFLHLPDSTLPLYFTSSQRQVCTGTSIQFTPYNYGAADTLVWNTGDGTVPRFINGAFNHSYDQAGTYPVILTRQSNVCNDAVFVSDTIRVHTYPQVALGDDTILCPGNTPIPLSNRIALPAGHQFLWNTGQTTSSILAGNTGVYALTVTNDAGCSTTDSLEIFKSCYLDIPNAFTPDGDGRNDYFIPLNLLSKGITSFQMVIYNRWGQKIFETASIHSQGWDGRLNDKEQPGGVYIYQIKVGFSNGITEQYQGNVSKL
jgi:gliding motility-associated-like protein